MHQRGFRQCLMVAGLLLIALGGAVAKDATVRIHVRPAQAYIYVDGSPFGDSSRTISVTPGAHIIGVYNYGFSPQVREVSLSPGKNADLMFTLVAVPGTTNGPWGRLQIEGASRAAVYLNGKTPEYLVGHGDEFNNSGTLFNCCTQQLIVPAGAHQVMVAAPNAKELWSGTVNVPANQRVILNVANGKLKVKPWPEGATLNSQSRFTAETASASIAVAPASGRIIAQPAQINCGGSSSLAWQTSETVQRAITSEAGTWKAEDANGSLSVQPKKATTYQLEASGPGGTFTSMASVDVNTTVQSSSFDASPAEVRYRRIGDRVLEQGSANLAWKVANANSVTIDPLGAVAANGTQVIPITPKQDSNGPVNEVQTYTLVAKNECGGSDTRTVSVRVTGSIEPIPEIPLVSVFFPTGYPDARHPKAGLVKSQMQALDRTTEGFKKYLEYDPQARLTIAGNADERDSNAKNKRLSERRANRVKEYLVSLGIPENKIETLANGETKQLSATTVRALHGENPHKLKKVGSFQDLAWAYNRRVDIVLQPKNVISAQQFPGNAPEADLLADSEWPSQREINEIVVLAGEKTRIPDNQKD